MANLKDWKDGEKLTGIDYTYERDTITDKIEDVDLQYRLKNQDVFLLDYQRPNKELEYDGLVWMNPNQFNVNRNFEGSVVNVEVSASGFTTIVGTKNIDTFVTTNSNANSYKLEFILNTPLSYNVVSNVSAFAYKVQQVYENLDYNITTSVSGDFYKQKIEKFDLDYDISTTTSGIFYKQQQDRLDLDYNISTTTSGNFYKQEQQRLDLDYDITTNISGDFYKQQQERSSSNYNVTTTVSGSFYKQDYENISIVKNVNTNVTVIAFKNLQQREDVDYDITTTVSGSFYKQEQNNESITYNTTTSSSGTAYKQILNNEDVDYDITTTVSGTFYKQEVKHKSITYDTTISAAGIGYKVSSVEKSVNYNATTSSSGTAYKAFDILAASNIEFTDVFTFDGSSQSTTINPGFSYLNTQIKDTTLQFDAPSIINDNGTYYQFSEAIYQIGPNNYSTSVLPRTITVTGTVYINFVYEEVPNITVYSRAISTPIETQFGPVSFDFTTIQNSVTVSTSTQSVEQQYINSHDFFDYPGNTLKIKLNDPTYTFNAFQYTWKSIKIYDDFNTLRRTFTNTGNSQVEFTFEPNATPTYLNSMYIDVEYEYVELYTVKLRLLGAPSLYVTSNFNSTPQNPDFTGVVYGGSSAVTVGTQPSTATYDLLFQRDLTIYGTTLSFSDLRVGSNSIMNLVTVNYSYINQNMYVGVSGMNFNDFANYVTPYSETEITIYFS